MAIYRKTRDKDGNLVPKPDFFVCCCSSEDNNALAELIVDAWGNSSFRDRLLKDRQSVKLFLAARGLHLQNPVVIEEETYYQGYHMQDDNEVVFVLPQQPGHEPGQRRSLLDTARLLMCVTPNGI